MWMRDAFKTLLESHYIVALHDYKNFIWVSSVGNVQTHFYSNAD